MQASLRQSLSERLASPPRYPYGRFAGRGIVTCAGGRRYFTCVWVLIWLLRRVHRCALPIQVWHLGLAEMSEGMRLLLEAEGVEVIDAQSVVSRHPARICTGWPLKPYAIAHSRFQEVLFLDADTVPLVDPAVVFDWDRYVRTGMLLWPDVVDLKAETPVWGTLGLTPRNCASVDSCAIAVDKERAWDVLDLAVGMNEHWEEVYDLVYGDKDTFLLAALLAGRAIEMIEHRPFLFTMDIVQRDPAGGAFLHHRTGSKWNLEGPNRPCFQTALDPACEAALAELRRRWSGAVFNAPSRSARACAKEAELVAQRWFAYRTASDRTLELLPGGTVGEGKDEYEQHWAVVERDGVLVLQFFTDVCLGVELTQLDDGTWRGRSFGLVPFHVRLVSLDRRETWPHLQTSAQTSAIARSCAGHLEALLDPSLMGSGFDGELERELRAGLSLLNRIFDDVPERLGDFTGTAGASEAWRPLLTEMAHALAADRDARIALTRDRLTKAYFMNMAQYSRVT